MTFLGGRSHEGKSEDSETGLREGFGSLNDTGVTFGAKANWAEPDSLQVGADAAVTPGKLSGVGSTTDATASRQPCSHLI